MVAGDQLIKVKSCERTVVKVSFLRIVIGEIGAISTNAKVIDASGNKQMGSGASKRYPRATNNGKINSCVVQFVSCGFLFRASTFLGRKKALWKMVSPTGTGC